MNLHSGVESGEDLNGLNGENFDLAVQQHSRVQTQTKVFTGNPSELHNQSSSEGNQHSGHPLDVCTTLPPGIPVEAP